MPLAATDVPGVEDLDGALPDDGSRGRCTDPGDTGGPRGDRKPPPAPGGYVDRLQTYRPTFEDLASIKYDAGKVENDGTIRITAADLG